LEARRIVVISATDIVKKQEAGRQDWARRESHGVVAATSATSITPKMWSFERPALLTSLGSSSCTGGALLYAAGHGCFDLMSAAGTASTRNYARGPAGFTVNMRLQRSWSFCETKRPSEANDMAGGPGGSGGPGGGPGGLGGFGSSASGKYNLTLSFNAQNLLNHANYGTPGGDLSSSYFGEYRSLAGGFGPTSGGLSTNNRKVDLQLRLSF
jgi:hypothetical protein